MAEGRNTEMYALTDMSSAVNHAIETLHSNELEVRITHRFANSHYTDFYLNEEQCQLLSRYLSRNIRFNSCDNLKRSTHPVASALNEFARKEIENNFFDVEILNIGGNPGKEIGSHYCNKVIDCRNDVRLKGKDCCVNGVENCSFKPASRIAVSVDSFYDIPIELLPYIMKRHELDVIHCYMYMPVELLNSNLRGLKKGEYNINVINNSAYFSFKDDLAPAYCHDLNNWLKFFKTTLITSKIFDENFNVFIEVIRSYGPFHHLTFTKTAYNNPTPRIFNISSLYSDFILLPDFHFVMCKKFCVKFKDVPKIPVKKLLFDRVYTYVTSGDDTTFNFNRCATFFRGITSKITIGQTVLIEQTELSGHSYDLVLFNIYVCSIISRLRRSKDLGNLISNIDNDYSSCDDFKQNPHYSMFGRFITKVKLWWQEKAHGGNRIEHINDLDSEDFMTFDAARFDDIVCNQIIDLNAGATIDKTKSSNKFFPFPIKPCIKKFLTTIFNFKLPIIKQTINLYVILDYLETIKIILINAHKSSILHNHIFDHNLLNSIASLYNFDFVICKENNIIYKNQLDLNLLQSLFIEYDIQYPFQALQAYRQNSFKLPKTLSTAPNNNDFFTIGVNFDNLNYNYDKIICDYSFYPYNLEKYHEVLYTNLEKFLLEFEPSKISISQSVFLDSVEFFNLFHNLLNKFSLKHKIIVSNFSFSPFIYVSKSECSSLEEVSNLLIKPNNCKYHNTYLLDYLNSNKISENNLTFDYNTNQLFVNNSIINFNDSNKDSISLHISFYFDSDKLMASSFVFYDGAGRSYVFDFPPLSIEDEQSTFGKYLIGVINASYFKEFDIYFNLGKPILELKYTRWLIDNLAFTHGPVNFRKLNLIASEDFPRLVRKYLMVNSYRYKNLVLLNESASIKKIKSTPQYDTTSQSNGYNGTTSISFSTTDTSSLSDVSSFTSVPSVHTDSLTIVSSLSTSSVSFTSNESEYEDIDNTFIVKQLLSDMVDKVNAIVNDSHDYNFNGSKVFEKDSQSQLIRVNNDEIPGLVKVITPPLKDDAVSREPSLNSGKSFELTFGDIDFKQFKSDTKESLKVSISEAKNSSVNFVNHNIELCEENKKSELISIEVNNFDKISIKSDTIDKGSTLSIESFRVLDNETGKKLIECVNSMSINSDVYNKATKYERSFLVKSRSYHKFDYMISKTGLERTTCLDIGCAPGHLSQLGYNQMHGFHYVGEGALKLKFGNKYTSITEFNDLSVVLTPDYDYEHLLIDIGNEDHNVNLYDFYFRFCHNNLKLMIFKCYLEQAHLVDLSKLSRFEKVSVTKPSYSFSLNREFYFVCQNFNDSNDIKHTIGYQFECIASSIIKAHEGYFSGNVPIEFEVEPYNKDQYSTYEFTVNKEMFNNFTGDMSMQLSRCDNKDLKKVVTNCNKIVIDTLEKLKKSKKSEVTVSCNIHNAPAGSRKSNLIITQATNFDYIVVPTRELKAKYDKRSKATCYTYHNAITKISGVSSNIFVDECYMFLKAYYAILKLNNPEAKFYLLGDSKQIGVIPFNLKFLDNYKLEFDTYNSVNSYRCPIDVPCYNKEYKFKSSNKKIFSIVTTNIIKFSNNKNLNGIPIICYKQSSKASLSKAFPNSKVNTIHEFQGGECDHVAWVLDVDEFSNIPQKHYNVALTRHNNTLIVVTNEPNKFDINYLNTLFDNINELHDKPLRSYVSLPPEDRVVIKECEDKSFFDKMKINHADLTTIFSKVNNLTSNENQYRNLSSTKFNEIKQGKLILSDTVFAEINPGKKGTFLTDINTAKNYNAKDKLAAVKTLIDRYTMTTKEFTDKEIVDYLPYLKRGLNKFLKYEYGSQNFKNRMRIDEQQWFDNTVDYLKSVHKKGRYPEGYDTDFDDENLRSKIKFFMKAQDKHAGLNFDFAQSDKAGQGVSAWDKMLNAIYCGFVRCFSQNLRKVLKDNVVYANGKSDAEIGAEIANNMRGMNSNKRYITIENDISQFDTGQSKLTVALECELMGMMGLSSVYIGLYKEHRAAWALSFGKFATLFGKGKKHSGEPFTIDFNSLLCLCINGLLFEVYTFEVVAFKGDDFYMVTDSVYLDKEKAEFIEKIGFKTKVYEGVIGEFTGYVVTPYGYYPDLLRVTQKFLNKQIVDEKYFDELKLAMSDRLQTISSNKWARLEGRWFYLTYINKKIVDAGFGRESLMNPSDVEIMESFMFNVYNWNYSDLITMIKPNLIINPQ